MCAHSMIADYYNQLTNPHWPQQPMPNVYPYPPVQPLQPYLLPVQHWDAESKQLLREVLERLDKLDKRLGDIECHDASKAELLKKLNESA